MAGELGANLAAHLAVLLTAAGDPAPGGTGLVIALGSVIVTLVGTVAAGGKWATGEISRLNAALTEQANKMLDRAVPAVEASTIATKAMTDIARTVSERLTASERERVRLELELEGIRRRRDTPHPEGT